MCEYHATNVASLIAITLPKLIWMRDKYGMEIDTFTSFFFLTSHFICKSIKMSLSYEIFEYAKRLSHQILKY